MNTPTYPGNVWWVLVFSAAAVILAKLVVRSTFLGLAVIVLLLGFIVALVWGQHLTRRRLIITLLACSILLPDIPVPGLWDMRPEEMITLALVPVILMQISWYWTRLDMFFVLIGISMIISMVWGTMLGVPFSPRDVMEFVKVAKYWLFFHLALYPWRERDIKTMIDSVLLCMAGAAFIGILQWRNWLGVGKLLLTLYSSGLSHAEKGRIVGTMANPNNFALLLVTGLALVTSVFKDSSRKRQIALILLGCLLVIVIAVIGSRTGGAGVVIVLMIEVGLRVIRSRFVRQRFAWLSMGLIAAVLIGIVFIPWVAKEFRKIEVMTLYEILDYVDQGPLHVLIYRFSVAASEEQGIGKRIENWRTHWELFQQSPVFGWGPGKSSYGTIVDNEYVFYLRRYGVIGLSVLFVLYGNIFCFGWKLLGFRSSVAWWMGAFLITTLLVYLGANFVLYTFYTLQLMSLFWLMVGMGYSMVFFSTGEKLKRVSSRKVDDSISVGVV